MSESAGSPSGSPRTPPQSRRTESLTDSLLSLTPQKASIAGKAAVPYSCGKYFIPGIKHFGIHLIALMVLNGSIASAVNYFKGRPAIPLKGALMEGAIQAGIHFLVMEGRSWNNAHSIRYAESLLTIEKLQSVAIGLLLTPPITYYGVKALLHPKINVLPTLIFTGLGGATLSILESIFVDYFRPK